MSAQDVYPSDPAAVDDQADMHEIADDEEDLSDDAMQPVAADALVVAAASRSSSPKSPRRSPEPSYADQLAAAAQAAGERAAGVAMAIRARAVCRLAASAASRRLLHLHQDRVIELHQARTEFTSLFPGGREEEDYEENEDRIANKTLYRRKKLIKVPHNTPLGRMVKRDEDRGLRHGLVVVPAWQHNRPWPPPVVTKKHRVLEVNNRNRGAKEPDEERKGKDGKRVEFTAQKRWQDVKAVSQFMSLRKRSQALRPQRPLEREASATREEASPIMERNPDHVDLEAAKTILSWPQKEAYGAIFKRFAMGSGGKLTRQGMQKAMQDINLCPTTASEQRKLKAVQEQVIEYSRGQMDAEQEEFNPLTSRNGCWDLDEFLLVIAAVKEIDRRNQRVANLQAAEEYGVPLQEVEEMRTVFCKFDADGSGTISMPELKVLLAAVELSTTAEDLVLLLESVNLGQEESLTFKQFLRVIVRVEEFLQPPVRRLRTGTTSAHMDVSETPSAAPSSSASPASALARSSSRSGGRKLEARNVLQKALSFSNQ